MEDLSYYNHEGSDLRKAQLKMLDILIQVAKICDQNNIPYWLASGTLIGAVRHKGFIPWDDDLDIEIERKNYKKLIPLLIKELPDSMTLQYEGNEKNYCFKYLKVRDKFSLIHEVNSVDFKERGIFIDIFSREYSFKIFKKTVRKLQGGSMVNLKLSTFKHKRKSLKQRLFIHLRIFLSKCLIIFARLLSLVLFPNRLFPSLEEAIIDTSGIKKKDVFPLKEIYFEGIKFKCPNNPDVFLTAIYGDYMKLPAP